MTTIYPFTYRISGLFSVMTSGERPARYFLIRDDASAFERAAVLAGMVKGSAEELNRTVASIARLTSVVSPNQETRARELLETLIDAKRAFVQEESKRTE